MASARESTRVKDADKRRVLDEASRNRRARKVLEALEQDNFHDDPHADLVMSKKVPKFNDSLEQSRSNRNAKTKRKNAEYIKARYRKSFVQLLEDEDRVSSGRHYGVVNLASSDDAAADQRVTYVSASAPASMLPERHFCAVCGFPSVYTCTSCGTRYCCIRCLATHRDTRCLKWTA